MDRRCSNGHDFIPDDNSCSSSSVQGANLRPQDIRGSGNITFQRKQTKRKIP